MITSYWILLLALTCIVNFPSATITKGIIMNVMYCAAVNENIISLVGKKIALLDIHFEGNVGDQMETIPLLIQVHRNSSNLS